MKESMMKGFKGAAVRCRKCGGTFNVVTPGTVSVAPEPADRRDRTAGLSSSYSPEETDGPAGGREDSPPGDAGERLQPTEAAMQPRATPAEKADPASPAPDNVYSLYRFREVRPKRLLTGGYDISGTIRPEPAISPAEKIPAASPPIPAPREEKKPVEDTLREKPVQWRIKGTPNPSDEDPVVPPGKSKIPELSLSDGSKFLARFTYSEYPRLTDIAIVYLVLLLLGGCGYLLVHFLSRMMGGGSG
jgi:hypothetical protein